MSTTEKPGTAGLPEVCAEAITFAVKLRRMPDPMPTPDDKEKLRAAMDRLRAEILALLKSLEAKGLDARLSRESVDLAEFAIVAFLDEIVMTSKWAMRGEWAKEPLQLHLHRTTVAGEQFFEYLNKIEAGRDPDRLGLLEIYATCIALGFRGKHGTAGGMEQLRGILSGLTRTFHSQSPHPNELSPHWEPTEETRAVLKSWPGWVFLAAAAALLVVLFSLSQILLHRSFDQLSERMGAILGQR